MSSDFQQRSANALCLIYYEFLFKEILLIYVLRTSTSDSRGFFQLVKKTD